MKTKIINEEQRAKILEEAIQAKFNVNEALKDGYTIVYCDELCTTKATMPTHDYSKINSPIKIDYKQFHKKTLATIAAISEINGVELIMSFDKSVNSDKFILFLKKL